MDPKKVFFAFKHMSVMFQHGSWMQAERDPLSDSQEQADMAQETQAMWSEALVSVSESMSNGRCSIWDEAARKVATLLAAPAAFQGEHFLQVSRQIFGTVLYDKYFRGKGWKNDTRTSICKLAM